MQGRRKVWKSGGGHVILGEDNVPFCLQRAWYKQKPCKRKSDLVLNGQIEYQNKLCYLENRVVREPCKQRTACIMKILFCLLNFTVFKSHVGQNVSDALRETFFEEFCL